MGRSQNNPTIRDEAELVAALDCDDWTVDDWLRNECDLVDDIEKDEDHDPLHSFARTVFGAGSHYLIDLRYPFALYQFQVEVERADRHIRGTIHAAALSEADTLGSPGHPDDDTDNLAHLLDVSDVDELAKVLAGEWQRMDFDVTHGDDGERIQAWFVPSDDRLLALGVSASALFVLPLQTDGREYWIATAELPSPSVWSWWVPERTDGELFRPPDDQVLLQDLRHALATTGSASSAARPSGDHVVRLSTKNLLVAGIDLDFEVNRGGHRLGTLSVSEGGLLWRPARAHRRKGRAKSGVKISWAEFATWAES